MTARNVERINITNWNQTGKNVQIPQYSFTLEIWWTDQDGVKRHHGPQEYLYPNDISSMPIEVRRAFAEQMIVATARVTLGIDDWEKYL